MKRMIKLFYILIVGLIVFTGALMIAQGLHTQKQEMAVVRGQAALPGTDEPEFAI